MRYLRLIVVTPLLISVSLLAGCQTIADKLSMETEKDAAISKDVREALLNDKDSDLTRVRVRTTNGAVDLSGTVPSLEARERAVKLAWTVNGVQTVTNHLEVGK